MRELSDTLLAAQRAVTLNPLYKITLTKGASSYTYDKARILPSKHDEGMYSHQAEIVLSNHDHELDDKDLKGYDAVISYGFGEEYSATAPLTVIDQQFNSDPNDLTCTLFLEGMPNLMAEDEASENYIPESDADETVKDLVEAIAGKTLAPFTHCTAFEVVWDDGYDDLADTYKPADGFRIYVRGTRLAAIRRLLDYTANIARFEADGKIHILKPVTTGTALDSEYALGKGHHNFFKKAYRNTLVIPNRVVVQSRSDDEPFYQGEAQTDDYDSLPDKVKKTRFVEARLESDDQADDIGEALIAKAEMSCSRGQAEVPINVGSEVFDYVKVTDSRQGDARTGNIGYIHRRFGKDKWTMTFGFGNWFDLLRYQAMLKELETYTDIDNYFSRLRVGTLYAYLDDIQDGPDLYIRQNYLHLDATGVYVSENTLYAIRVPGEAEHNLWKQDSAPTSPDTGDFWLDTNYTPNKVMIWDGDSWEEATSEQLAEFGRSTIVRRLKGASLTADGLVVLDEVQEGTYGLVLYTSIEAGKILLSKTAKDGKWYEESGVVIDATYGISLYGGEGINAFRTFASKEDYGGDAGKSGEATATTANHLIDTTNAQFEAGDVGKIVYNLNDETTAKVTAYNSASDLTLDTDIMAEGESYCLYGTAHAQVYIGTNGKLYAGAGAVKIDASGITIYGEEMLKIGNAEQNLRGYLQGVGDNFYIRSSGSGVDIILIPSGDSVRPGGFNKDLGSTSDPWHGGYFSDRLKIPVGTDLYD